MVLYTGKGDKGTTKLFTSKRGERLPKNDPIFETLGTVDELNTVLGWCRAACQVDWLVGEKTVSATLLDVQQHLFTIQAELAGAGKRIPQRSVAELEKRIAVIEAQIPAVTSFFVPGGSELSSRLDIARAVSRRAERHLVGLSEDGRGVSEYTLVYANRLSSLLYALVRFVNHTNGIEEKPAEYVE
jgi:cob(I)alamin adenosyltransferase